MSKTFPVSVITKDVAEKAAKTRADKAAKVTDPKVVPAPVVVGLELVAGEALSWTVCGVDEKGNGGIDLSADAVLAVRSTNAGVLAVTGSGMSFAVKPADNLAIGAPVQCAVVGVVSWQDPTNGIGPMEFAYQMTVSGLPGPVTNPVITAGAVSPVVV
jgi:hypothetical protein